jgi:uracil-DNA glycosylase family 4
MTQPARPSPDDLARQLRQRLESLAEAGIDYVPKAVRLPEPTADRGDKPRGSPGTAEPLPVVEAAADLFGGVPLASAGQTAEQRRQELTLLADQVRHCTRCPELASTRTQTVFGVGPIDADVCFIGEAPGADEDRQGEPFVGPAGQLLNKIIAASGLKREEVFICNILRCRPPGNRPPKPNEAANCREYLDRTLELVRPKFLCCLGASAANYLLGISSPIGKLRGRFFNYHDIPVICTYHPSFLLRSPTYQNKAAVWEDMKKLLTKMGKPIPQGKKQG